MRIGSLRKAFVLERALFPALDGASDWETLTTVWGNLEPAAPDRRELSRRITHSITIRRRDGIATGMRLRRGERLYLIREALDIGEAGKWLKLLVEEILPVD